MAAFLLTVSSKTKYLWMFSLAKNYLRNFHLKLISVCKIFFSREKLFKDNILLQIINFSLQHKFFGSILIRMFRNDAKTSERFLCAQIEGTEAK